MKYELTPDLLTGNALIDSEHRQLFAAINDLMDACSQGKGRDKILSTAKFLTGYVAKHFGDEEQLQMRSKYPNYPAHKQFPRRVPPEAGRDGPAADCRGGHGPGAGRAEPGGGDAGFPYPHRRQAPGQARPRGKVRWR